MYEVHSAIRTMVVLDQKMIGLITQETTAMWTDIVTLKLMAQFLAFLRNLGGIPVCLDKEDNGNEDSQSIKQHIPCTPSTCGDT